MADVNTFYQTVGFHFYVSFTGLGQEQDSIDARFQSVAGFDVNLETETYREGGENRFEHTLPVRTRYADLVLKRGLLAPDDASVLTDWCRRAYDNWGGQMPLKQPGQLPIRPIDLQVILLNEAHEPLLKWDIRHAWPKAWKLGEFNAERSEVLIETIELHHNGFFYKKG